MGSGWLKALEVRGPVAFLAFLAAALISLGFEFHLFSLEALPVWVAGSANAASILFGVLSLPWLIETACSPLKRMRMRSRRQERLIRQLQSLSLDEAEVLFSRIVDQDQVVHTDNGPLGGHVGVSGLYRRDLLEFMGATRDMVTYRIRDEVWDVVGNDVEVAREQLQKLKALKASRGGW